MFHYKGCGHYRTIEPEYQEASAILEESDDVILAWVDTKDFPAIPRRYGVQGAPVFKWFAKGTTEADKFYFVHYNGRMGNTLLKMVGERVDGFVKQLPPEKDYVTKVKGKGFEAAARDPTKKAVLCYVYSSWSATDEINLVLRRVGSAFEGEDSVSLVKMAIDTIVERDLTVKYNLSPYPGFFAFLDGGEKWEQVPLENPTVPALVSYLNGKVGTSREYVGAGTPGAVYRPPGATVAAMDRFAAAGPDVRPVTEAVVSEAEAVLETLQGGGAGGGAAAAAAAAGASGGDPKAAEHGKTYVKVLKKILELGEDYVGAELKRLESLLSKGSVSAKKRADFVARKEILRSFANGFDRQQQAPPGEDRKIDKDEL